MSLLRVVRAFSVMTIIFGFFNFVMSLLLICCITRVLYPALICGFLTWVSALITWAVYLGFKNQCVIGSQFIVPSTYSGYSSTSGYYYGSTGATNSGVTLGSGWCLAVAAFPLAVVAHLLDLLWCVKCRKDCAPACPCPCPCPAPLPCPPMPMNYSASPGPYFAAPMECPPPSPAGTPGFALGSPMAYTSAI
jgi:hypothetical protein